jgi:hypothetical protein
MALPTRRRWTPLTVEQLEPREQPATIQNFDVEGVGTPFVPHQWNNPPAAQALPGGPTGEGRFLRVVDAVPQPAPPSFNTLAFPVTDPGLHNLITLEADVRFTPVFTRADGMGLTLANTAVFPVVGTEGGNAEEAGLPLSFGLGLDLYANANLGDLGNPSILPNFSNSMSLHYDGQVKAQFDLTNLVGDVGSGQWYRLQAVLEFVPAGLTVTVTLRPGTSGSAVTVVDRFHIAGVPMYESRLHVGARAGGETASHDIDNIVVNWLDASVGVVSLANATVAADEGQPVTITLTRVGNTQNAVTVHYTTADLSATAGSDYNAAVGSVVMGPGETSKTFTVATLPDDDLEGDERFRVGLLGVTGPAVLGPSETVVTLFDEETARQVGRWEPPLPAVTAVHAHLAPDGVVLIWDRINAVQLYDPATGTLTPLDGPMHNLFCSGHAWLGDGTLLIAGGHQHDGSPLADGVGLETALVYDPRTDSFTMLDDFHQGRWYPTVTALPNGGALVLSGSYDLALTKNTLPQVLEPATNTWRDLTGADLLAPLGADLYPWMFLMEDGKRVIKVGMDQASFILSLDGDGDWVAGPVTHGPHRSYGTAVMYDINKVLLAGGGDPPTNVVETIDLAAGTLEFELVTPMPTARRQATGLTLPDGRVIVVGGSSAAGFSNPVGAVLQGDVWNPRTDQWVSTPATDIPRLYHSIALLLPDGSVLVGGGGQGAGVTSFQASLQRYLPDYFFKGARPVITDAPESVGYGESFFVATPQAASIRKAALVRTASVTHAFDQNARYIPVTFTVEAGGVRVNAPVEGDVAPGGHYMLFLIDDQGVPAVAPILQLGAHVALGPAGAPTVAEGAAGSFTLALDGVPTANVTVSLAGDSLVSADRATLVFTPANWSVPQVVNVMTADNVVREGTRSGSIRLSVSSADPKFDGIRTSPVVVTVLDNEPPPPTPVAVAPVVDRGGVRLIHHRKTGRVRAVIVPFTADMDTVRAVRLANYLLRVGPKGLKSPRRAGRIASVVYDPATRSVTLTVVGLRATDIQGLLRLSGLASPLGTLLDGDEDGQPGGEALLGFSLRPRRRR